MLSEVLIYDIERLISIVSHEFMLTLSTLWTIYYVFACRMIDPFPLIQSLQATTIWIHFRLSPRCLFTAAPWLYWRLTSVWPYAWARISMQSPFTQVVFWECTEYTDTCQHDSNQCCIGIMNQWKWTLFRAFIFIWQDTQWEIYLNQTEYW